MTLIIEDEIWVAASRRLVAAAIRRGEYKMLYSGTPKTACCSGAAGGELTMEREQLPFLLCKNRDVWPPVVTRVKDIQMGRDISTIHDAMALSF